MSRSTRTAPFLLLLLLAPYALGLGTQEGEGGAAPLRDAPADDAPEAAAGAPAPEPSEFGLRYVVGYRAGATDYAARAESYGASLAGSDDALRFAVFVPRDEDAFFRAVKQDPDVRYVEPDHVARALYVPNDPRWSSQYGPQNVGAPAAWDVSRGSTVAAVCIVDTGVRYTHEDINGTRWKGGYDFVNNDADPADDNGHGTHVAGTAAATLNNSKGVAGMGNVAVYGVKVLNSGGSGTYSWVASGIRWCADNTMNRTVISLSLGGSSNSSVLYDAVVHAVSRGKLVVAAAGNDGCNGCVGYPARFSQAIAVACTTSSRALCGFSSRGPEVDIAAPGYDVVSAWHTSDTAYNTISGTSMSTPHVSGAAALLWSKHTTLTAAGLRTLLEQTALDLGTPGVDGSFGAGELNVAAAMSPLPPSAPRSFNATFVGSRVELSWEPPASTYGNVTGYKVYRGVDGGALALLASLDGTKRSHVDSSCATVSACRYQVRAVNWKGIGNGTPERVPVANTAPTVGALSCAPALVLPGQPVTCTVDVRDDSAGVFYNVTWGDGTWTRLPPSGFGAAGRLQETHVFSLSGLRRVNVTVQDSGGLKATRTANVTVQSLNDCGTGTDAGNNFTHATPLGLPVTDCEGLLGSSDDHDYYRVNVTSGQRVEIALRPNSASDFDLCLLDVSGVSRACSTRGGSSIDTISHVAEGTGQWRILVYRYHGSGSYNLTANATAPPPNSAPVFRHLACMDSSARVGDQVTCLVKANDDSAGVFYTFNWGDGTSSRYPSSGYTRPNSTRSASHVWSTSGTFTVAITVTDSSGQTATITTTQFVEPA